MVSVLEGFHCIPKYTALKYTGLFVFMEILARQYAWLRINGGHLEGQMLQSHTDV